MRPGTADANGADPSRLNFNIGTQTLIGKSVNSGLAGHLSRSATPKSNALLADQKWELPIAEKVVSINQLRENLWDFMYLCWKTTEMGAGGPRR